MWVLLYVLISFFKSFSFLYILLYFCSVVFFCHKTSNQLMYISSCFISSLGCLKLCVILFYLCMYEFSYGLRSSFFFCFPLLFIVTMSIFFKMYMMMMVFVFYFIQFHFFSFAHLAHCKFCSIYV